MILEKDSQEFFKKLAMVWRNFDDYTYFEGIVLSEEQKNIIEHNSNQLLIEGHAGTGKSITLLYKLINVLIQQKNKRVLYVTLNKTLVDDTIKRLNSSKKFRDNKDKHDVELCTFHEIASKVLKQHKIINQSISRLSVEMINKYRDTAYMRVAVILARYKEVGNKEYKDLLPEERLYKTHDVNFVLDEIIWIKAMGFIDQDKYLKIERIGRSKSIRLTRAQRKTIYKIFMDYENELNVKYNGDLDLEDYALEIVKKKYLITEADKFDYVFVDEVQDLDPMQIAALVILTKGSIVLSEDTKQSIYKKCPVKYEDIGLNIKEKVNRKSLNKNYRSTAEIVKLANDLEFSDIEDKLSEKYFLKNGQKPVIYIGELNKTVSFICKKIKSIFEKDDSKTIAIITRDDTKSNYGNNRSVFRNVLERKLPISIIDIKTYHFKFNYKAKKQVFYTNVYNVKGLEFDVVFIIDFNKYSYPYSKEIERIRNENEGKDEKLIKDDIAEFTNREKKLLYVAMTRAKEELYLVANRCEDKTNVSPFIFDFESAHYNAKQFTKKYINRLKQINLLSNRK